MGLSNLTFLSRGTPVEHEVGGETLLFLPLSFGVVLELKELIEPTAVALSDLMSPTEGDAKRHRNDVFDREPGTEKISRSDSTVVIDAVDLEVRRYRDERRQQSIKLLASALSSSNTQRLLGKVILNSCRAMDGFGSKSPSADDCRELMDALDLDTLVCLLEGVFKANRKLFGPLAPKARDLLKKKSTAEALASAERELAFVPDEQDSEETTDGGT